MTGSVRQALVKTYVPSPVALKPVSLLNTGWLDLQSKGVEPCCWAVVLNCLRRMNSSESTEYSRRSYTPVPICRVDDGINHGEASTSDRR